VVLKSKEIEEMKNEVEEASENVDITDIPRC
jgi:hypothetical protein